MKRRLIYVELKGGQSDCGPAWIGYSMRSFLAFIFLTASPLCVLADSPAEPEPLVFASSRGGRAIFTMMPPEYDSDYKQVKDAFGVAYLLQSDGKLKELYRTKGWYSFEVFVSADGRYLVQMGPWNVGRAPTSEDLAVAFFKDGKEIKRYSTADLVKDPSKVIVSTSHYMWRAPDFRKKYQKGQALALLPQLNDYEKEFVLNTIDNWTYYFDIETGKLIRSEQTKTE
jgi:hypothetical protein